MHEIASMGQKQKWKMLRDKQFNTKKCGLFVVSYPYPFSFSNSIGDIFCKININTNTYV